MWQVSLAYKLTKQYSVESIIRTIRNKRIWGLHAQWIKDEIQKEHLLLIEQKAKNETISHKFKDTKKSTGRKRKPKNKFEGLS